jgi:general secretion pathway protein A
VDVAFILNPKLTDVELLATICDELRIPYPAGTTSRKVYVDALHHHLLDAHGRGHRTVLIIDEAQDLAPDVLEQIRLLTNLETTTQKLLQIILIGQPELIRILEREDLRQLAQRVTARYHLRPFAEPDTRSYIAHRLEVAGAKEKIVSDAAMRAVHHASRGIPRLINAICDRALLGAFSQDRRRVIAPTVRRAAGEVLGAAGPRRGRRWRWVGAAVAAGALLAGAAMLIAQPRISPSAGGPFTAWIKPGPAMPGPGPAPPVPAPLVTPSPTASMTSTPPDSKVMAPASGAASEKKPATPASVTLGELLADPAVRADKKSAFASLYARWRLDFDGTKTALGCERGRAEGLECLFKTGTWAKLRRYNVPAIIELSAPNGERRYATVVALGENTATLDFGGRRYVLPFSEVDRYWEGPFIVLWRAASVTASSIAPGARGKDVEWVRQRLSEMDGAPVGGRQRDIFDEDLRSRVMAFQRARSLVADGIVGEETLLHLSAGARDQRIPRLSETGS